MPSIKIVHGLKGSGMIYGSKSKVVRKNKKGGMLPLLAAALLPSLLPALMGNGLQSNDEYSTNLKRLTHDLKTIQITKPKGPSRRYVEF